MRTRTLLTDRVETTDGTLRASGEHLKPLDRDRAAQHLEALAADGVTRMWTRRFRRLRFTVVLGHGLTRELDWNREHKRLTVGGYLIGFIAQRA